MKDVNFAWFLLILMLSACGQPGPLYLPTDKLPIYVEPEPATKNTEAKPTLEQQTKPELKQQEKPETPPKPENTQPTTTQ